MDIDADLASDGSVPQVAWALIGKSSDVGWKYGKYYDPNNKSKVKCDFCGHICTNDIYQSKNTF
jgi:hypothetical protein